MAARPTSRGLNVVADGIDFRDRIYQPSVVRAPNPKHDSLSSLDAKQVENFPVLDQESSSACTGFALASVVNYLRRASGLEHDASISARMLYSMARRYDEFPGSKADTGSSVRGALKGWYRHGAASAETWGNDQGTMPLANPKKPEEDWWFDAVKRPLGAYYRVETRSIPDLHVALAEVGVVVASAVCHRGWFRGAETGRVETAGVWEIPFEAAQPDDGGHAFMIYGYDRDGFLILNSWGKGWGSDGRARLRYEDWQVHAMDCWVAQLGVETAEHAEVAGAGGLRVKNKRVTLSNDEVLRAREISPFIIDMENNGRLSHSGRFRTGEDDIESLLRDLVPKARKEWGLAPSDALDVAIYAHGGLTGEDAAAKTAAQWIPALYEARIFPIFFFWETGLFQTLESIATEALRGQPRPSGGLLDKLGRWWDQRLENLLAAPGTAIWGEMKENAALISTHARGGGKVLYSVNGRLKPKPLAPKTTRLHLIGHSAGAIVHCHLADQLIAAGWSFESVHFMAPAVTVEDFKRLLLPHLVSGKVARSTQLHLTDDAEQKDPTCRPILGYGRSLLYLVSESFEGGRETPILGMERSFREHIKPLGLKNLRAFTPGDIHASVSTHGGFDDDEAVRSFLVHEMRRGGSSAAVGGRPSARGAATKKKRS